MVVKPENPNEEIIEATIVGETFIKPKKTYDFTFTGEATANWFIDKKYPITYEIEDNIIHLKWNSTYSG